MTSTSAAGSERTTSVSVTAGDPVAGCRMVTGALSPRLLHRDPGGARVALIATGALLLGGDHVVIDVEVGEGAWLEIVETAGTVAYNGSGATASWTVRARVAAGGWLRWNALPFVVADGADVTRTTVLDLAAGARALVRETFVLGRVGERGGELRSVMRASTGGVPTLLEDLGAGPGGRAPGVLGEHRVLDQVLALGWRPAADDDPAGTATRLDLARPGTLTRVLADATHRTRAIDAVEQAWGASVHQDVTALSTRS